MEFQENKPIYLQLADKLMDDVERGIAFGGERIPSVREYAAGAGVNANTVMRTYTWLQQEGIIFNQRGIGYFYAENAREIVKEMRRKAFFEKDMQYFMERLAVMEITPDQLKDYYEKYIEKFRVLDSANN